MKLVKITAKEGMRIRIPEENYRVLPKDGAFVRWNMHWAKAKVRGEIEVGEEQETGAKPDAKTGANPEVSVKLDAPGLAVS